MTTLKVGDRVRVTTSNSLARFQRGDKGTVTAGPTTGAQGEVYYEVSMDLDSFAATTGLFTADEIELDS